MVKFIYLICTFVFLNSCIKTNKFNYSRIKTNNLGILPNNDSTFYKVIDTNCIYRLVIVKYFNASGPDKVSNEFYKFFSNGRVGHYNSNKFNIKKDSVFDSNEGEMGVFTIIDKKIIGHFFYNSFHGSRIQKDTIFIENDTLLKTLNGIGKSIINSFYAKEILSKNILITRPDW